MSTPLVTYACPTFGRAARQPHLMNELVYWFTQTTYQNCELVILNDCAGQTLVCDVPGVRVVNTASRIPSLGDKMNELVALAEGEIVIPWEDDDVSLPWRAAQAVRMLAGEWEYWNPRAYWSHTTADKYFRADGKGYGHNASAYRRRAFLNRYEPHSKGHDSAAESWAQKNLNCNPQKITDYGEASYVYRWGVSDLHLSAFWGSRDLDELYLNNDPGPPGVYRIEPRMRFDYPAARERALQSPDLFTLIP